MTENISNEIRARLMVDLGLFLSLHGQCLCQIHSVKYMTGKDYVRNRNKQWFMTES